MECLSTAVDEFEQKPNTKTAQPKQQHFGLVHQIMLALERKTVYVFVCICVAYSAFLGYVLHRKLHHWTGIFTAFFHLKLITRETFK